MARKFDSSAAEPATGPREARPTAFSRAVERIKEELGEAWLPRIYREKVLRMRTRSHKLAVGGGKNGVEIQHTLLGVELKVGRQRMLCPDLATARYMAVFARAGCEEVAVPYDISRISTLADELESSWHRMLLLVAQAAGTRGAPYISRIRNLLVSQARQEIREAGAGSAVPQFNQNTKQRRA